MFIKLANRFKDYQANFTKLHIGIGAQVTQRVKLRFYYANESVAGVVANGLSLFTSEEARFDVDQRRIHQNDVQVGLEHTRRNSAQWKQNRYLGVSLSFELWCLSVVGPATFGLHDCEQKCR